MRNMQVLHWWEIKELRAGCSLVSHLFIPEQVLRFVLWRTQTLTSLSCILCCCSQIPDMRRLDDCMHPVKGCVPLLKSPHQLTHRSMKYDRARANQTCELDPTGTQ